LWMFAALSKPWRSSGEATKASKSFESQVNSRRMNARIVWDQLSSSKMIHILRLLSRCMSSSQPTSQKCCSQLSWIWRTVRERLDLQETQWTNSTCGGFNATARLARMITLTKVERFIGRTSNLNCKTSHSFKVVPTIPVENCFLFQETTPDEQSHNWIVYLNVWQKKTSRYG
jgi:hypothetical protein